MPSEVSGFTVSGRVLPNALQLCWSAERGYGVFATRPLQVGTTLLAENPWNVALSDGRAAGGRCGWCLQPVVLKAPKGRRECGGGCGRQYCCEGCLTKDGGAHARSGECHLLRDAAAQRQLGCFVREAALAARVAHDEPLQPPLSGNAHLLCQPECDGGSGRLLRSMAGAVLRAQQQARRERPAEAGPGGGGGEDGGGNGSGEAAASAAPQRAGWEEAAGAALEACCQVFTNALEVALPCSDHLPMPHPPIAVYRLLSRVNHSCRPSAAYSFRRSGQAVLRLLQPLAAGEEVTITYCDGMLPRAVRREQLQEKYRFDCACARCAAAPSPAVRCHQEAEAALADAVDRGCRLLVVDAQPEASAAALQRVLSDWALPPAQRVEPLHHQLLQAAAALASAHRICSGSAAASAAAAATHMQCAAQYALVPVLAGGALLQQGETAAAPHLQHSLRGACDKLCGLVRAMVQLSSHSAANSAGKRKRTADDAGGILPGEAAAPAPDLPASRRVACRYFDAVLAAVSAPHPDASSSAAAECSGFGALQAQLQCARQALAPAASVEQLQSMTAILDPALSLPALSSLPCCSSCEPASPPRAPSDSRFCRTLLEAALLLCCCHSQLVALGRLLHGETGAAQQPLLFQPFFSELDFPLASAVVQASHAIQPANAPISAPPQPPSSRACASASSGDGLLPPLRPACAGDALPA